MSEKSTTFRRNPEPVVFSGRKSSREETNDDHRYDLEALVNEKSSSNHSHRDEKKKSKKSSLRGRYSKYSPKGLNSHHSHHDREYNPSFRNSGGGYRGSSSLKRKSFRGRGFGGDSYHRRSERNNDNDQDYPYHNHRGKNNRRVVIFPRSPQYSPTSGFSVPDHSPSRRSLRYSPTRRPFMTSDRSPPRSDFDFYGDSYHRSNTRNYPSRRSRESSFPSTHRRSSLDDSPLPSSSSSSSSTTTTTTESGTTESGTTFRQQRSHSNQDDHPHRPREEENNEPLDVYKILDCSPLQEFDDGGDDDTAMKDSLPLSRSSSSSSSYVHYDYYTQDYATTLDCEDDPMDETQEDHCCPSGPKEKTKSGKLMDDNRSNDDDDDNNREEKKTGTTPRSISLAPLSQMIIDEFQPSSPLSWEYPDEEDCSSDEKELHTTTNNSLLDTLPSMATTTTAAPTPTPTPKSPPPVTLPSKPITTTTATTTTLSKQCKGSLPATSRKTQKKRNRNPTRIVVCDDEDDEITEFSSQEVKQPPPRRPSPIPSNSAMSNKENKGLLISLRESPQKTKHTPNKTLSSHTRTLPVSPTKSTPTTTKPSTSLTTPQSPLDPPPSLSNGISSSTAATARYVKIQPLDYQGDVAPGDGVYSIFVDCHSGQKVAPSVVDVPHAPFVDDGSEEKRTKEIVRRIQSRTIESLKVERNRLLNHLRFTSHWDITKTDHPFFGSLCLSPCNLDREEFLKLRKRCTKEFVIGAFSELWITPSGFLFVVSKCYKKYNKNQKLTLNMTSKSNNRFVVSFEDMTFVPQFSNVIRLIENKADGSEELVSKIIAHQNLVPTKSSTSAQPSSKSSQNPPPALSSSFYVPDPYFFYLISTRKTKPSETLNALMAYSSSGNDDGHWQQRDSPEIDSQKALFIEKKIHSLVENGLLISGIESFDQHSTTTTTTNLTETKIEQQQQHDGRVSDLNLPVCNAQSTISTETTLTSPGTAGQPSLPLATTKKRTRRDNDLVNKSGSSDDDDDEVVEPPIKSPKRDIGHRLREDCLSGGLDEITRTNLRTFFSDILSSIPKDFPETLEEFYTQTMEEIDDNNNNILNGITARLSQFLFTAQMMKSQLSVPRQPP